jgi:hypothetical protein
MKPLLLALAITMLPLAPIAALAGTTGSYSGIAVNEVGAPIPGALVSISSPSAVRQTRTDAHGYFLFLTLPPDTYVLTMERVGYNPISTRIAVCADLYPQRRLQMLKHLNGSLGHIQRHVIERLVKPEAGDDVYEANLEDDSITP